jgi:hypothetical protein
MNGKGVTLFHIWVVLMINSGLVWAAKIGKVQTETSKKRVDQLKIVVSYADAMLEHRRDRYGWSHSPLFAAALDRKNMKLVGKVSKIKGIRNGDRVLKGGKPMHDDEGLILIIGQQDWRIEEDFMVSEKFQWGKLDVRQVPELTGER